MERVVLQEVELTARHEPTGNTRHFRDGALLGPPAALQIVRFAGEQGYYLLYLDADGEEQTDTWHEDLDAAKHQAEFEFGVHADEWTVVASDD